MKNQKSQHTFSETNGSLQSNFKQDEKRKYFRVKTILHLKHKIIDKNLLPNGESSIRNKLYNDLNFHSELIEENTISSIDTEIISFLRKIDVKLNLIITSLKLKDAENLCSGELTEIILSGNGLSFPSKTSFKKDEWLEIEIDFPNQIPSALFLTGKVVNCKKNSKSDYYVSVTFINILPFEEERIIKHTLACQRETIKKR